MPKFENPMPSFEKDDFNYEKENPPAKEGEIFPEAPKQPMTEEEFEKEEAEFEKMDKGLEAQGEELEKEADAKSGSDRLKGPAGFFGKAAIAIAALFGGAKESQSAEPPKPEKTAPTYTIPFKYENQGPQMNPNMERPQAKPEIFVTSKSLAEMLGVAETEDLGEGSYSVVLGGKKYKIGQECLAEMAKIRAKYNILHGNARYINRADAMIKMRNDLRSVVKRMGEEMQYEKKAPASKLKIEKPKIEKKGPPPVVPARPSKKDYYKDSGAYNKYNYK